MLSLTNVSYDIKKKRILDDINVSFDNGVYGFLGPNGAGKTTLMRCITGVYKLKHGKIVLDDNLHIDDKEYINNMGYLPQYFGLFKDMTVKDMLLYLAMLNGMDEKEAKADIVECIEKVNLSDKLNNKVKTLSGGMMRRLGIAQAIMGNPRVILFDEPTTGLDPEERIRFKNIIKDLPKDRIIIISTHIVSDVEDVCDKVIVMNNGHILFNDETEKLSSMGEESAEILKCSPLEAGFLRLVK